MDELASKQLRKSLEVNYKDDDEFSNGEYV